MQAKIVVILLSFGLIFLVVVATAKFGDRVPSSSSEKISPSRLFSSSKPHLSTKEPEASPQTQSSKVITGTQDTHVSGSYRIAEEINVPLPSVSSTTSTTKTPDEKASLDQDLIPAPSAPPQYRRRHDIGSHSPPSPPRPPSGPGYDPHGHQGYHHGPSQEYNYHNEIPGSFSSYGPSHDTSGSAFSPRTPDFMKDLLSAFETLQRRQQQERNNENVGSTSPTPNFVYPSTTLSPQPRASVAFEKRSFDSAASSPEPPSDPNFNFDRFFHEGMRGGPDGSYGYHSPSESSYEGPPIPQSPLPPPFPTFTNNNRGNNNRNNQKQQNPQRRGNVNQGNNQRRIDLNRQPSNHAPGRRNDHGSQGYLPRHDPHEGSHYGPTSGPDPQSNYGGNEGMIGPAQNENSGNKGGPSVPSSYFLPLGVPDPDNDPRARVIKEHVGNINSEGKPFGSKMTYSFRDPKKPNNFMEVTEVKMSMNKRYDNSNGSESPSVSGSSRSHSFPDFGLFRPSFHPRPPSIDGFYDGFLEDGFTDF